jgi:squalene synthase HpnC
MLATRWLGRQTTRAPSGADRNEGAGEVDGVDPALGTPRGNRGALRASRPTGPDEYETLERIAARSAPQMGGENFPVALRVVPGAARAHLARIYGFARFIDDVGDTAPGDRLRLLDVVDNDVQALDTGAARLTPVRALAALRAECGVPLEPFLDLIEANRVDQTVSRYASFADLLDYCRLSAAPVGRLVLYVAGAATDANVRDSDQVCAALQVLEHCQDVGEDARAGRIYLPSDELRAAGIEDAQLLEAATGGRLRSVISVQVTRSVELLDRGRPLVRRLSGWARIAVGGYVGGGLATADALRAGDFDVLARAIRPSRARTAGHALRIAAPW